MAVITRGGLHLAFVEPGARDADGFLERHRSWMEECGANPGSIPKAVADCLCVAVRGVRKYRRTCRLLPARRLSGLAAGDFMRLFQRDDEAEL